MDDKQKEPEIIFFQWLSETASNEDYKEIQSSFERTNLLLARAKVLSCRVTEVTSARQIEKALTKSRKAFVNARARTSVIKLLQEYLKFLNEKDALNKHVTNSEEKLENGRQAYFFDWLSKKVSSAQLSNLYRAYVELQGYLLSKAGYYRYVQEITNITDSAVVHKLYKELSSSHDFLKHERAKGMLSVLWLYVQFVNENETKAQKQITKEKELLSSIETKQGVKEKNIESYERKAQTVIKLDKEDNNQNSKEMEQSLSLLLQDKEFEVLRKALISKGILTLEEFSKINLWVFLNENGLYSIGQRFTVYNQLKTQIEQNEEQEQVYNLKTINREYKGYSPAAVFLKYCESISQRLPLRFRGVIGTTDKLTGKRILSSMRLKEDDLQLKNPTAYIDSCLDEKDALRFAQLVCIKCHDSESPISLEKRGNESNGFKMESRSSNKQQEQESKNEGNSKNNNSWKTSNISKTQAQVEKAILAKDLEGITIDQLSAEFPQITIVALKQIRDNSRGLVEIGEKIIHIDAFVDIEEAAAKLQEIIDKLMIKNNGYTSAAQLYEYARAEIQMFLNDNDIDDERSVYCVARYLFGKIHWHGVSYKFSGGNHISKEGVGSVETNLDVILKYARDNGGFFSYDSLVQYLVRVGIKTGNLRGQMQIGAKPIFFYYSSDDIITAESMHIDGEWLTQIKNALQRIFSDSGDHIIVREINPVWFAQLPTLPGYRAWTPLLLQYVLYFYGKELGARTIGSELNQKYDVLHSMLVSNNSEIKTFSDTIVAYLVDNGIEQRKFEAEALRQLLVQGKMIEGNELISHMPKAIGKDPRFAWDMAGKTVIIKV